MKALHVFCHNAVLVRDENGKECIATGKGVGFMKKKGDRINQQLIQNIYFEEDAINKRKVI